MSTGTSTRALSVRKWSSRRAGATDRESGTVTSTAGTPISSSSGLGPASCCERPARSRPRMEVVMIVPAVVSDEVPVLDLDRLDVYRAAVQFCAVASRLRVTPASLRDQVDRASASVVLTLAEGIGRVSGPDRAHFFAMARGSAFECAAFLDLLHARGSLSTASHTESRRLLVRVVQMLTRLIGRQRAAVTTRRAQTRA